MKYVVDSSVTVNGVLTEPDSDKALRPRDDLRKSVHELLSPDIFTVEASPRSDTSERQVRKEVSKPEKAAAWRAKLEM
jgi:hypothetical protein